MFKFEWNLSFIKNDSHPRNEDHLSSIFSSEKLNLQNLCCFICQNTMWSTANPSPGLMFHSTIIGQPIFSASLVRGNPEQLMLLRYSTGYIRIPSAPCPSLSSIESALWNTSSLKVIEGTALTNTWPCLQRWSLLARGMPPGPPVHLFDPGTGTHVSSESSNLDLCPHCQSHSNLYINAIHTYLQVLK